MEPIMMLVITAIIAAIILVVFNKQQESKMSNHMYTNDVQQLYLLTAAEYKINALENQQQINALENQQQFNETSDDTGAGAPNIAQELNQLTAAFESGELPLNELNLKLDYLLNVLNKKNSNMVHI
jgi:hypothetical protein